MTDNPTRREFLIQSALLAAGVSALPLLRSTPSLAQGQRSIVAEDLMDIGEKFHHGSAKRVALGSVPNEAVLRATGDKGVFTSRILQSSAPFTHVGLHWSADVPSDAGLDFELRTSTDGSSWSSWSAAQVRRQPEETPVGDFFASLAYTDGARFVQYRTTFEAAGGSSPSMKRVTATVIDSPATTTASAATGEQLPTTLVQDADSGRALDVTSREQWGATEKYRFDRRDRELWPEMFAPAKKLVVHHTAHPQRLCYGRRSHRRSPGDHYYHAVTQRYGDIGYTALIDKFGNVYEGRHGRGEGTAREILSAGVVAGHDYAHNYGSAGVALLGDATQPGWAMTGGPEDPTWHALVSFGVFEAGRHFIRPLKTDDATATASDFLRSDNVWTNNMHNVSGHRETNSTACPGEAVMTLLDELQSEVHGALSDTSRTGVLLSTAPGGREARVNTPITYEWAAEQPEGDWTLDGYEYCLEGWYKLSNSNDITYLKGYTTGTTQPRPLYTPVSKETTSLKFTPTKAGQYTFHVQVVFKRTGVDGTEVRRRSAYEGRHTFLVK